MSPMTRRITNAYEHELILFPGFLQCLIAPWIPINGIVSVLEQIGAGFFDQPVGGMHDKKEPRMFRGLNLFGCF